MPAPFFLIITVALGLTASAAILFWHKVLDWAERSLFPWVERNIPALAPIVRKGFAQLDKIAVSTRRAVRAAWEKLRTVLLQTVVTLQRRNSSVWLQQVTSYVVRILNGKRTPVKIVTEEEVGYDELPDAVREEYVRQNRTHAELDITKARDQELAEVLA